VEVSFRRAGRGLGSGGFEARGLEHKWPLHLDSIQRSAAFVSAS